MNKKAASFSSWLEVIVLCVSLVICFGFILNGDNGLNSIHGGNYSLGLGTDDTVNQLSGLQSQIQSKTQAGTVTFLGYLGMSLSTAWDMSLGIIALIWNFITGGWIESILTGMLNVPAIITMLIRMLWFMSILFVIYKLVFRVNT